MIVSQPALLCLTSFWNNLTGRVSAPEIRPNAAPKPAAPPAAAVERASAIREERLKQAAQIAPLQPELVAATHETLVAHAAPVVEDPAAAAPAVQPAASGAGPLT